MKWKQLSFAGGELAPELYGRIDTVKYSTGLATCRNAIAKRSGPVERRPGTKYICSTKNNTAKLVKFVFSQNDALVLECGSGYVRFVKNGAQIIGELGYRGTVDQTVTPWAVTKAGHPYSTGDQIVFNPNLNPLSGGTTYTITKTGANTFTLDGTVLIPAIADIPCMFRRISPASTAPLEITHAYGRPLNYAQSGDVLFCTSSTVASIYSDAELLDPFKIVRYDDYVWEVEAFSFAPTISAPTNVVSGAVGTAYYYKVTAVSDSFEESLPSSSGGSSSMTSTITWTAVSGAREYNVYRSIGTREQYFYIGSSSVASFTDASINADESVAPPEAEFVPGNPAAVTIAQQRLFYGGFSSNTEAVWGSRIGMYYNYTFSYPSQESDAVLFSLAGRDVQGINQMVESGTLLSFTNGGVWNIKGNSESSITPTSINAKQVTYDGAANVRPVVIGSTVLYVQTKGSIVSDIAYEDASQSYEPRDLSVFSTHFFEGYTIDAWDYHKFPHHCVWSVRDDGDLLGLTYMREQEIWGWHKHDTDGAFQDVVTIPESTVDGTYFIVSRDINGSSVDYIERMADVAYSEVINDHWMVDCGLSYDGHLRNPDGTDSSAVFQVDGTLPLGPGGWTNNEQCYLTSDQAIFTAGEVGNVYEIINGSDRVFLTVEEFWSTQGLICRPQSNIPVSLRSPALITDWNRCVDEVGGLSHLEGKTVSALLDGEAITDAVVSGGTVSFDTTGAQIQIGLAYTTDIVTLPLDNPQKPITDNNIIIQEVCAQFKSAGMWQAGPNLNTLTEPPIRYDEDMGEATELQNGKVTFFITGEWQDSGQIAIRQDKPLPFTLLSLTMKGRVGA